MATSPDRIGSLLLSRQVINRAQLRHALQLQRAQRQKRIGQILLEQRYLSKAVLIRYLGWQKCLRSIAMLITLLGAPMEAVLAEPFYRFNWRSSCETLICLQTRQAEAKTLIIDLGRAIKNLKALGQSPYGRGETEPSEAVLKSENTLRFNLSISAEQSGFELVYRF
jgi:hypothetical protein